jgi:hypothetical protein
MARMVVSASPAQPRASRIASDFLDLLSPRRRLLRELRARWGKPGTNDAWLASRYFELTRLPDGARQLDDRTWNDLEFPRIFAKLDSAVTRVGSQSLYRRLRTYQDDAASARAEYAAFQTLRADPHLRETIQLTLAGLQADTAAHLCDHLFGKPLANLKHPIWIGLWGLLSLTVLALTLASVVSPLLLVAVLAVNAAIIFGAGLRVQGLVEDLRRACDLVAVAGRLARLRSGVRIPQLDALAAAGEVVRDARRAFRGFSWFQQAPFGIAT